MAVTTKPPTKPKRPLSAFNLFYRYKRSLLSGVGNISNDIVQNIITCPAGLENEKDTLSTQPKIDTNSILTPSTDNINEKRRSKIRSALDGNILPADTSKRRHRKTVNGPSMDFVEMGRMMTDAWKSTDTYGKKVFDELAAEGRDIYRVKLEEYNHKIETSVGVVAAGTIGGGEDGGGGDIIEKYDAPLKSAPSKSKGSSSIIAPPRRLSSSSSSSSGKKKASRKEKKNTAHKVSRSVAKKRPSQDSMDASPIHWSSPIKPMEDEAVTHFGSREPFSVEEFMIKMLSDDEGEEGPLLRPKPKRASTGGAGARPASSFPFPHRRHTLPDPEEIARLLARSAPAHHGATAGYEDFYKPMLQQQRQFPGSMFPQYPPPFDVSQYPPPFDVSQFSSAGFPMGNQQQHGGGVNGMVPSPSKSRSYPSHNGNNQEHVPPLTPVSQSSGSGRSASDLPNAFNGSSCIDRNSFPFGRENRLQQQYQCQQREQHFPSAGGHFKTTGLPQQDSLDKNFYPTMTQQYQHQQQQRDHFNNFQAHPSVAKSNTFPYHEEKKNDSSQNSQTMKGGQHAMSNEPMSMLDNEFLNDHFDDPDFQYDMGEIDLDNEEVMNVFD
ncbi:hypothetical protein ACHAWC_008290 [Mediolabrus comicus]